MGTVSTVSFSNTPQAKDDLFAPLELTEDSLKVFVLDVMANDLGGNAKSLYSVDDGTCATGVASTDLLKQDSTMSTEFSFRGAKIWITADGKVGYDASTLTAECKAQLQALNAGETLTDSFTYAIRLGNGTLSWPILAGCEMAALTDKRSHPRKRTRGG